MDNKNKGGRPPKELDDLRNIGVRVSITKGEEKKLLKLMKKLSAGSISNTFRMLLNEKEI